MRWLLVRAAFAAWLGLFAIASEGATALTDDRGAQARSGPPPQRIVSLLPALTESVCALGHCARLVGVDRYSNHPASVTQLPQLGGGIEPYIEAIVRLRPDLVLIAGSSRAVNRLEALGLRVFTLEPKTHADVSSMLLKLEQLLGPASPPGPSAAQLWAEIDHGVAAAAQSLPPTSRGATIFFEVGRGPYAAGESSFIGETLSRLGARNTVAKALGPFPLLNPEFVVRANPDVLMFSASEPWVLYPGWSTLAAVRDQRICRFDAQQADVVVRPGPRLAEGARILAACLARTTP
jgi:iron complex transport system substrate-binding protein